MAMINRQIVLAARPEGMPKPSDFRLVEAPMPQPAEGQLLVKTNYLSVDPYMRGRISEAKSYAEPVEIGQVMVGGTVGGIEWTPEIESGRAVQ
jgi:NADPH-dependent curcumin reductase